MQKSQAPRGAAAVYIRFMDTVNHWLTRVCGLALAGMVVSVFIGVLARFVFTHTSIRISVPWTEEVSRYLMIWTVFVGGGIACRQGKLIGVEFVVHALPPALGRGVKYISFLLSALFYSLMCFIGWQWVEFGNSQTSPVMEIPMVVVNLAMIVGGVLMTLNTVALVLATRGAGKDIRYAAEDDELEAALEQIEQAQRQQRRDEASVPELQLKTGTPA